MAFFNVTPTGSIVIVSDTGISSDETASRSVQEGSRPDRADARGQDSGEGQAREVGVWWQAPAGRLPVYG